MFNRPLVELYSFYKTKGITCYFLTDRDILCIILRTFLGNEAVDLEFMVKFAENDNLRFIITVFGIGSVSKLVNIDGDFDERELVRMIKKFNANHKSENFSLRSDINGNFLILSEKYFNNTTQDFLTLHLEIFSIKTFIEKNYKDIKKIVKYFG